MLPLRPLQHPGLPHESLAGGQALVLKGVRQTYGAGREQVKGGEEACGEV